MVFKLEAAVGAEFHVLDPLPLLMKGFLSCVMCLSTYQVYYTISGADCQQPRPEKPKRGGKNAFAGSCGFPIDAGRFFML
jgi:hypothetical protein